MKTIQQTNDGSVEWNGTGQILAATPNGRGLVDFVTALPLSPQAPLNLPPDQLAVIQLVHVELRIAGSPPAAPTSIRCILTPLTAPEQSAITIFDTTKNADAVPAGFNVIGCGIPVPREGNDIGVPWVVRLICIGIAVASTFTVSYTSGRV